jgi:predicted nucleic acid-binding protein
MMKRTFVGYYTPTEDEFGALWAEARIVLDANVLLAAYGVSPSTRETLFRLLEKIQERLWIPNQFALEYQRRRLSKILEQVKHYEDAHRNLKVMLENQFRSRTQHPFVSEQVEGGLEDICKTLLEGKIEQEKLLSTDPHFLRITELFEGRVGAAYTEPELIQAYDTARRRFGGQIPPGFRDSDKPEPERYGDYVGWRQILDFAAKNNCSVILVTDDAKDDWWRRLGSQTFGPRPELVVEFRSTCSGLFYMYSSDRFLEFSGKYIGGPVDPKAINELKVRRESEIPPDAKKASEAKSAGPEAPKSTGYNVESDAGIIALDSPKSTGEDFQKPEEK